MPVLIFRGSCCHVRVVQPVLFSQIRLGEFAKITSIKLQRDRRPHTMNFLISALSGQQSANLTADLFWFWIPA